MSRRPSQKKRRPKPDGKYLASTLALMTAGLIFTSAMGFAFSVGQFRSQSGGSASESPPPSAEIRGLLAPRPEQAPSGAANIARRDKAIEALSSDGTHFECASATVTDGDTLRCGDLRVRLAGIDAPELPGHCRPGRQCVEGDPFASASNLESLTYSKPLSCIAVETDAYGRTVAFCGYGSVDLSCAQLASGSAIERYSPITCEGSRRIE